MDNKEPTWFISALRWAFSIMLILILFFLIFSFIYYSEISLDSKISSFFSFISTFGIAATIGVYFWQKKERKNEIKMKIKSCRKALAREEDKIKELYRDAIDIANILKKHNDGCIYIRLRAMSFSFIFENGDDPKSIIVYESDRVKLLNISNQALSLDARLYEKCRVWIKRYDIFVRNFESLFLEKNTSSPRKDRLENNVRFGERIIERIGEIHDKINK